MYLCPTPISWYAKKQNTIARCSTAAEYRSSAHTATELSWVRTLLKDLRIYLPACPSIWCDNIFAVALASNPVFHARTKHVEVDYHFIWENVLRKDLSIHHISTQDNVADIFTKGIHPKRFYLLSSKLGG